MHQNHQLRQRPEGGKTEVRHGDGDKREHPYRRVTHHHVGHFKHGLGDRAEHGHQRFAVRRGQRGEPQTKQDREEDNRQHLALRHRGHDVGRYQRKDSAHQAVRMALHVSGCTLVFRNIHRSQLRHINPGTRLEHVRQGDTENDRNRSDHFEIDNGFRTNTT